MVYDLFRRIFFLVGRNKNSFKENFGFIKIDKDPPFEEIETHRANCENLNCESGSRPNHTKDEFCLIEKNSYSPTLYPCDGSQNIATQCWSFAYEIETRKSCLISITPSVAGECQGLNSLIVFLNSSSVLT